MLKIVSVALSLMLAMSPALFSQTTSPGPQDKEARLKQLAELLKSFSDDDYQLALSQVPNQNKNQQLVSRGAVLKSVYNSLAAFEYEQAGRKVDSAPTAGGVQEAGQATDVLKWLANATLNYWLKGGQTYVGREIAADSPTAKLDQTLAGLETRLADGALDAQKKADLHLEKAKLYEQLAAAPLETEPEEARLKRKAERVLKLADLLKSVTDEDYQEALKSLPAEASASRAKLADRRQVLRSSYLSLAALEYRRGAKKEGSPSAAAYKRLIQNDSETMVVNPETLQETGWAMDLSKWLGNAALNYWLHGGEDFMNRGFEPGGSRGRLEPEVESGETQAAAALGGSPESDASFRKGQAYEALAAAAAQPESPARLAALKKERLKMLAELLQSVSEEDYKETIALIPEDSPAREHLASRRQVLKSAYTTLAALEYKDAARSEPLERLQRDERDSLVINPETLQETGWGKKLLGIAALGGIGYAVYKNQEELGIRPRGSRRSASVSPPQSAPAEPTPAKPKCRETLSCEGVRSKNCPTDGSVEIVILAAQCAPRSECPGLPPAQCASRDEACPRGRGEIETICHKKCPKGRVFIEGECAPYFRAIRCEGQSTVLPSGVPFCANLVCAEGQRPAGAVCVAKKIDPPKKCPAGFVWDEQGVYEGPPPCFKSAGPRTCFAQGRPASLLHCLPQPDRPCPAHFSWSPSYPEAVLECLRNNDCVMGSNPTTVDPRKCLRPQASIQPPPSPCPRERIRPNGKCLADVVFAPPARARDPREPRMHCMAYIPACGYPELKLEKGPRTLASARVADLYRSLEDLESGLSGVEASASRSSEIHGGLGAIYEQLAADSFEEPPILADSAPIEPPVQEPAAPQNEPSSPSPQADENPRPKPQKGPRVKKPQPSKEDMLQSEMKDMDDMEKKMRQEVERRRTEETQD